MSWIEPLTPHEVFAKAADEELLPRQPRPFVLEVWESKPSK